MRRAVWDVEEYSLKKGEWKFRLVKWGAVLLSILASIVGSRGFGRSVGRSLARVLGQKAIEHDAPWLILIPGVIAVLLLIFGMVSAVRKGYALSAIPLGLICIVVLLAYLFVFYGPDGESSFLTGFLIAELVLTALMVASTVAVDLYYRKLGRPMPTRYGYNYSPAFMIGLLIVCLILLTACGVMILITSNNP